MRNLELPGRSTVHSLNGMAATSQPLASQAAVAVLQAGGNAIDAAVTASAVLCVVEPQSTGIGGDCFCLISPKGSGVVAYNGSGRAPAALSAEILKDQGLEKIPDQSPHAVTIPGAIDAWARLLADHGTISLGDALQPAIRLASDGYTIHHRVHEDFASNVDYLQTDTNAARIFLPGGKPPPVGGVHHQPELAATMAAIADQGRDGFYGGEIAQDMVDRLRELGGLHTMADFENAAGEWVTPIKTSYAGHDVYECPPNGQGIVALVMLNILKGFDLQALAPLSAERLHLEIEAARLAYRDRDRILADPAMADVPVEQWLSDEHAAACRAHISPSKAMDPLPASDFPNHRDTVYLSVVDKDRNAVSFINSTFYSFGSGIVAPKSGIVLHNRGQGFTLEDGHPNQLAPGKRPMHTIIPAMLMKEGRAAMPFGVMGGHYQACGHAHLLTNLFEYGMDLQEAIDFPRVFPFDGHVEVEHTVPEAVRAELTAMGHNLVQPAKPIGGAQAIAINWDTGVLSGGSEPRKDGMAIGY